MRGPILASLLAIVSALPACTQVYSPHILGKGTPDTRSMEALVQGIFANAKATTPRAKAEAIWRFFLTDGRFVAPGFWYHIPGWTYEEPGGQVLDPVKLMNSYGFGVCYHLAPMLQAAYKAGGFEDARVWFLTGHGVAEVFYDGAYHYFDSDMMGYTIVRGSNPKTGVVASVQQIADDGNILLSKVSGDFVKHVDNPWYPADVRAHAMKDLADLFTSKQDNWLFAFTRYKQGHTMDFVLRPGETLYRSYVPPAELEFYLPFRFDGEKWVEFTTAANAPFGANAFSGPKSFVDPRLWGVGRFEYRPELHATASYYPFRGAQLQRNVALPLDAQGWLSAQDHSQPAVAVFEMPSPYVVYNAAVSANVQLEAGDSVEVETSTDAGKTWAAMDRRQGPFQGVWKTAAPRIAAGRGGYWTTVGGSYGFLVRFTLRAASPAHTVRMNEVALTSFVQVNPRSLPQLGWGKSEFSYSSGAPQVRRTLPVDVSRIANSAASVKGARFVREGDQGMLVDSGNGAAEVLFELSAPDYSALTGVDMGARFLDLADDIAPDKNTAEIRKSAIRTRRNGVPKASIAWAPNATGPYKTLWEYDAKLVWKDGVPVQQVLRWPEVDRSVRDLDSGAKRVYVRYQFENMALDDIRLAMIHTAAATNCRVQVTHAWSADGVLKSHVENIPDASKPYRYVVDTGKTGKVGRNESLTISCLPSK